MKIIKQDDATLILKDRNVAGLIFGIIFVLLGLLSFNSPVIGIQTKAPWSITILFILFGLLSIFLPSVDTIIFSKKENKLTIKNKSLIWSRIDGCNLDQIKEVKLLVISATNFPDQAAPFYKIACVLTDGKEIMLSPTKSSFTSSRFGIVKIVNVPARVLGQNIANFLGVTFQEEKRSRYSYYPPMPPYINSQS